MAPRSRLRCDLTSALKPERLLARPPLDDLLEPDERAAADEEDVGRVDLEELLVRVLAPPLRRNVGHRALQNLQERLLHPFARHVAGDRGVLVLAADLVDLVDIDDALLALLDIAAGRLQQLEDDVLDVLADVARLGEGRRVDDGEGHRQQLGERLREQRLAGARRADQHDVRLGQLDVVAAARLLLDLDALVVVVDRDGELLLRLFLADHVLVEELLDFLRHGQRRPDAPVVEPVVVRDDVVADLDALVADEDGGARNELADVVLIFVTERAPQDFVFAFCFDHNGGLRPFPDYIINDTVFLALVGIHDVVPLGVLHNPLDRLTRVVDENLVQPLPHPQNLPRGDVDVGRLTAQAPTSAAGE